jgi:hypothetical protein
VSESVAWFIENSNIPRFERPPNPVALYVGEDNVVRVAAGIEDGQFIVDLPGFVTHTDEVHANNVIPVTCLSVTDTDLIVDLDPSAFEMAPKLRRSFHFNAIVKIFRLVEEPRVALFATRTRGPLLEEKGKRWLAIAGRGRAAGDPLAAVCAADGSSFRLMS